MDVLYPIASDAVERPIIDTDVRMGRFYRQFYRWHWTASQWALQWRHPAQTMVSCRNLVHYQEVDILRQRVQVAVLPGSGQGWHECMAVASTVSSSNHWQQLRPLVTLNSLQLVTRFKRRPKSALAEPTAAGIPITIPPVPAFIQSRSPAVNATGVLPSPDIHVVLNQGDPR